MFTVTITVLLLLFAYVDVWYFIRVVVLIFPARIRQLLIRGSRRCTRNDILQTTCVQGVVLPSDLDLQLHMNNSKYLREMDFGRIYHYVHTNFYHHVGSLGGTVVIAATTIRYRKSLRLWERFTLQTQILCWGDDAVYMEQKFVNRDGFVRAIALLKMCAKGVTLERVLEKLCTDTHKSPPFPPEVESWAEAVSRSKESMKKERMGQLRM